MFGAKEGKSWKSSGCCFCQWSPWKWRQEGKTNSCHLPRVLEEVPFTARNVTRSEVSQRLPAEEGGRQPGEIRGTEQGKGPDMAGGGGRSKAIIFLGAGMGKEPTGRDVPQDEEAPLYRRHVCQLAY